MAGKATVSARGLAHDIQKELLCAVCLDLLDDPRMLKCQHTFCLSCLTQVAAGKAWIQCPTCRTHTLLDGGFSVDVKSLAPNLLAVSILSCLRKDNVCADGRLDSGSQENGASASPLVATAMPFHPTSSSSASADAIAEPTASVSQGDSGATASAAERPSHRLDYDHIDFIVRQTKRPGVMQFRRCVSCAHPFPSEEALQLHYQESTHRWNCQCTESFSILSELQAHQTRSHHKGYSSEYPTFSCPACCSVFNSPEVLLEHCDSTRHHQCSTCQECFASTSELLNHLFEQQHHRCHCCSRMLFLFEEEHVRMSCHNCEDTFSLCCFECDRTFQSASALHNHHRSTRHPYHIHELVPGDMRSPAAHWGTVFSWMEYKAEEEIYEDDLDLLDEISLFSELFMADLRFNSDDNEVEDDVDDFVHEGFGEVERTQNTRNAMKFSCGVCHTLFNSRDDMLAHQRNYCHFNCDVCDCYFERESALQQHQRDLGHHSCCFCDRQLRSAQALRQHERDTAHYLTCNSCARRFCTLRALNDHRQSTGHPCVNGRYFEFF